MGHVLAWSMGTVLVHHSEWSKGRGSRVEQGDGSRASFGVEHGDGSCASIEVKHGDGSPASLGVKTKGLLKQCHFITRAPFKSHQIKPKDNKK